MINIMEELNDDLKREGKNWADIEWAYIRCNVNQIEATLKPEYSMDDLEHFMEILKDMGWYDDEHGWQDLYGVVVLKQGGWFTRKEMDGAEWWQYNIKPTFEAFIKDADERMDTEE